MALEVDGVRIVETDETPGNVITGHYDEESWFGAVTFDGASLSAKTSQKLWNASPDGFAWGYSGSGPTQLAFGILLAAGVPKDKARVLTFRFRDRFIAPLSRASFRVTIDVQTWVEQQRS